MTGAVCGGTKRTQHMVRGCFSREMIVRHRTSVCAMDDYHQHFEGDDSV